MTMLLGDPAAFRAEVLLSPTATADNHLPAERIRYAQNGWFIGLSINA